MYLVAITSATKKKKKKKKKKNMAITSAILYNLQLSGNNISHHGKTSAIILDIKQVVLPSTTNNKKLAITPATNIKNGNNICHT